jgi:hypothetical protein
LVYDERVQYYTCHPHSYPDLLDQVVEAAEETLQPLEKLITSLEDAEAKDERKGGRDPADNDWVVKEIARLYREHIGTPSSYSNGPFFAHVENVLKILNLPHQDPSRRIRAALKD